MIAHVEAATADRPQLRSTALTLNTFPRRRAGTCVVDWFYAFGEPRLIEVSCHHGYRWNEGAAFRPAPGAPGSCEECIEGRCAHDGLTGDGPTLTDAGWDQLLHSAHTVPEPIDPAADWMTPHIRVSDDALERLREQFRSGKLRYDLVGAPEARFFAGFDVVADPKMPPGMVGMVGADGKLTLAGPVPTPPEHEAGLARLAAWVKGDEHVDPLVDADALLRVDVEDTLARYEERELDGPTAAAEIEAATERWRKYRTPRAQEVTVPKPIESDGELDVHLRRPEPTEGDVVFEVLQSFPMTFAGDDIAAGRIEMRKGTFITVPATDEARLRAFAGVEGQMVRRVEETA